MKRIAYVAAALLTLAGCQRTADFEADKAAEVQSVMASYPGQTIADFLRKNSNFALVDGGGAPERQTFIFETSPVYVTTTTPSYTPPPRTYNDAGIGAGFNNLSASISATPAVSQTAVRVCRVTIIATQKGEGATPADWLIARADASGTC